MSDVTTDESKNNRKKLAILAGLLLLGGGAAAVAFTGGSSEEDFTAASPEAQAAQQVCFDAGLFYDAAGNCYEVNPASIVVEDRPAFVIDPATVPVAVPDESGTEEEDVADGTSTGQAAPSAGNSTGQSNPSTTTQQPAPSDDSQAQPNPSDDGQAAPSDDTTASPSASASPTTSPSASPSTSPSASPSPTTSPSATPSPTPSAAPILAVTRNEWRFSFNPDVPPEGCSIDDDDVNVNLSEDCLALDRAYAQSSNFICDVAAGGRMSCTQDDQNRDMTVTGSFTRSSISLVRQTPGQARTSVSQLTGSTVRDGSTPGEVCFLSGRQSETVFDQNGDTQTVMGSWSAERNAPGC